MFRSFASALVSFIAILLFAFAILFLWNGSEGINFARVAFEGDRSTVTILEQYRREQMKIADAARLEEERASKGMATSETPEPVAAKGGDGPAVVVWISIPGFRGDYLEKAETPFLDKLATDGGATNKMRPNFPCLTFPAHATLATGV
ncbi:MAG: alkaline phosphatase family protein, partial [Verrucomicrobiales bacterium]